jgi:Na+-driven multidrug efflux pump
MAGGFLVPLNAALGGYFTGLGRTTVNMFANFFGCSLNVLLNYLFISDTPGCRRWEFAARPMPL